MYLKSIEVHGFKSFYSKLLFEFHDGITGIVGPNGSGKSNVADAVRWVLGEQSAKQLRGSKMEDVIFAGTQLRKPVGYAYVAITIDNSDHKLPVSFEEVTVSRRVYRSGESEYKINGAACRLRDVQDLFLDTGIGKEGYSIIGQGQIEKILSGKPEERRELFDEAAGIVKFKKRKLQAMKELEKEHFNLTRINDILAEQERQVGPLKHQAEKAHKYLQMKEELKEQDACLFLLGYEQYEKEWKEVKEKISINEGDLKKQAVLLERIRQRNEVLEKKQAEKETLLEKENEALRKAEAQKKDQETQILVTEEQIRFAKENDQQLSKRLKELSERRNKARQEKEAYEAEVKKQEKEGEEFLARKEAVWKEQQKKEAQIQEKEAQLESHNAMLREIQKAGMELSSQKSKQEALLEQNAINRAAQAQRLLKCKGKQEECLHQKRELDSRMEQVTKEEEKLLQEQQKNEEAREETRSRMDAKQKELEQKRREEIQTRSQLEALKGLTERYEGYGLSIQKIMEQRDRIDGIVGVVSDIISVKKEYETAIEIALGGNIRNIVTKNETTAKQLIGFLKRNRFGRATFLPLNTIKSRGEWKEKEALKEPGVLGTASSLVSCKEIYKEIVEYMLGQILVVDGIDQALAISRKYKNRFRMVTLEGELLNPGGSISGGAYRNSSNLLGRHGEIEELEKRKKEIPSELSHIRTEIEQLQEVRKKQKEVAEEARNALQKISLSKNTLQGEFRQLYHEQEENEKEYQLCKKEAKLLEQKNAELADQVEHMEKHLEESIGKSRMDQERMDAIRLELQNDRQELEGFRQKLTELSMKNATQAQACQHARENAVRAANMLLELSEEEKELEKQQSDSVSQKAEKEMGIISLQNEIRAQEENIEKILHIIEEIKAEKETLSMEYKAAAREREEYNENTLRLEKEKSRLGMIYDRVEEKKESIVNYMWDEYHLTYSATLKWKEEGRLTIEDSFEKLEKAIKKKKEEIRALGDVNVNAIEDYRELSERYELMKTQHEDLVQSEETLTKIIEELDQGMRRQFEEKFAEIRAQFLMVFRELFGGGKADLELVENEDILEAGIRINAQPPGKKLQNMMQLSGGEKSLTAISLLFAIQNLKPSPFCLLDEIEAALDDSNVDRFAQYLHKLTRHTQFIVITHRRGTMNAADRLYGITMQEKGISTMVSINLEDAEDKLALEKGNGQGIDQETKRE